MAAGLTLVLEDRRVPILIDLNGGVVHRLDGVRAVGRARLLPNGHLLSISRDRTLVEVDWDGVPAWKYIHPDAEELIHHDVIRLSNGRTMAIVRSQRQPTDYLLEIDERGAETWRWDSVQVLDVFPGADRHPLDPVHMNSVQELPSNPLFEAGDGRFRPGNLLVSARNVSTVFVLDRTTEEIVWQYSRGLDFQHEAVMIPNGLPHAGRILLFDNGYRRAHERDERRSAVVEIDPSSDTETWRWSDPLFFSAVGGTAQPLANGNVLVTSSEGGRVFELSRSGDEVWEWVPPWELPMRAVRYEPAFCPQLASVPRPELRPVAGPGTPHVDRHLYMFALPEHFGRRRILGSRRTFLHRPSGCRTLLLPPRAELVLEYGLDPEKQGDASLAVRFSATIGSVGERRVETLVDEMVASPTDTWRRSTFDLGGRGMSRVRVCLDAAAVAGTARPQAIVWSNPIVRPARTESVEETGLSVDPELERKQLQALGYVN